MSRWHFVLHKSHTDWTQFESRSSWTRLPTFVYSYTHSGHEWSGFTLSGCSHPKSSCSASASVIPWEIRSERSVTSRTALKWLWRTDLPENSKVTKNCLIMVINGDRNNEYVVEVLKIQSAKFLPQEPENLWKVVFIFVSWKFLYFYQFFLDVFFTSYANFTLNVF